MVVASAMPLRSLALMLAGSSLLSLASTFSLLFYYQPDVLASAWVATGVPCLLFWLQFVMVEALSRRSGDCRRIHQDDSRIRLYQPPE